MGATCCSSQTVAKCPSEAIPKTLPPPSHHDSESRRKKRVASAPIEPVVRSPSVTAKPPFSVSVPATATTSQQRLSTGVTLDPALDLLTDTFAVSATTLSDPDDAAGDASSWVDVSLLTHSIHPHLRTASDAVSDADLASWDPTHDLLRAGQRRERERFMRVEADTRARLETRAADSRCKLAVRAYKEEFMLQRRVLLRDFFLERLSLFIDACEMQCDVGVASVEMTEAAEWSTLLAGASDTESLATASVQPGLSPDRLTHTSKSFDEGLNPSQSPMATTETDPLSSSYADTTHSSAPTAGSRSSLRAAHVDPRSVVHTKTVARVEQTKQPELSEREEISAA